MAPANDIKAAKATYEGFVNLVKWSTPAICVLVAIVILVIQ
ncbi:aa3-type cytochrome c oxidase subunit IV [Novosphingobium sp. ERN07]|nr:aa3-type cytochrome c oxidase subunit IV [Novosphingobium sp. ERN07]NLR69909.1 aa3-type cytochrome c oxidase subunit IV [Novosphingobium sp. ERN07]